MRWLRRGILFLGVLMLAVTAWSYEQYPCVRNLEGKIVCPPPGGKCLVDAFGKIACSPPYGGIVKTFNGEMLCGPGKCMINVSGVAFCSAVYEGSMTLTLRRTHLHRWLYTRVCVSVHLARVWQTG
jgi:hypothetical protein